MCKVHIEPALRFGFLFDRGYKTDQVRIPWRLFVHVGPVTVELGWTK